MTPTVSTAATTATKASAQGQFHHKGPQGRPLGFLRLSILLLSTLLLSALLSSCAGNNAGQSARQTNPQEILWDHGPLPEVDDPSPSPATFRDLLELEPDPAQSLGAEQADWYKDSVFYHVWVSAFRDSNDDGIGDIPGVTQALDYLVELGVTGIWLSPFFASVSQPINLHMYDAIDHYTVDPRFGTNDDLDELLVQAHNRGIRVIFDYVPNHVSDQHPWFQDSANSANGRRDWFVWRGEEGSQEGPWGQNVWHGRNDAYYYGVFWGGMPDINFRHQAAKDAITNVAIHWLNRGFDGMRVDAVKYLYEDARSVPGGYDDQAETIAYFQALRQQILDAYGEIQDAQGRGYHKFMVAENWTNSTESLIRYMVQDDSPAFHMTLDFPFAYAAANRSPLRLSNHWDWSANQLPEQAWMGTFLSNHDNVVNRPWSTHGNELLPAVVAAQLLGPGTPFLYYGNEIGMPDAAQFDGRSHADRRHRQPFDWEAVRFQNQEPASLLNSTRQLTALRSQRPSLQRGNYSLLGTQGSLMAFQRVLGSERSLVLLNLSIHPWEGPWNLEEFLEPALGRELENLQPDFMLGEGQPLLSAGTLSGNLAPGATALWFLDGE